MNLYGFVGNDGLSAFDYLGHANAREAWIAIKKGVVLAEWDEYETRFVLSESESDDEICVYRIRSRKVHHRTTGSILWKFVADNSERVVNHIEDKLFDGLREKVSKKIKGPVTVTYDVVVGGIQESLKDGTEVPDGFKPTGNSVDALEDTEITSVGNWTPAIYPGNIWKERRSKVPPCPCPDVKTEFTIKNFVDYRKKSPLIPDSNNLNNK